MMNKSFKTCNQQSFQTDLARSSLESVEHIVNPNLALQPFCSIVKVIFSKYSPIKEKRVKFDTQSKS
jgi:hypothetical protein